MTCWGADAYSHPPGGEFAEVGSGFSTTCGVRPAGGRVCWGDNRYGQGVPPAGPFAQINTVSGSVNCGIRPSGEAVCWGDVNAWLIPQPGVFQQLSGATNPGGAYLCGLRVDGTVECWGGGLEEPPPPGSFSTISAGWDHRCGIRLDETAVCWGDLFMIDDLVPPEGSYLDVAAGGNQAGFTGQPSKKARPADL